jgi:hypothetical protein
VNAEEILERITTRHGDLREAMERLKTSQDKLKNSREKSEVDSMRLDELLDASTKMCKELGIIHKFEDTTTGEIHEVQPDDHETFNKMMSNRNMKMLLG